MRQECKKRGIKDLTSAATARARARAAIPQTKPQPAVSKKKASNSPETEISSGL